MASEIFTASINTNLRGPTGRVLADEIVVRGATVEADSWVRSADLVNAGCRLVIRIDGIEPALKRWILDADLEPYSNPPTEPPAGERYIDYYHDGIVERFVPDEPVG